MKKTNRIVMFSILAILFCFILFLFLRYAPSVYMQYQKESRAYPDAGYYYCKELDAYLVFNHKSVMIELADDSQEKIRVHPAGRFCSIDAEIDMWYAWNKQKGYLEIEIISFPDAGKEEVFYFFEIAQS